MAIFRLDPEKNKMIITPQREDDFTILMKLPSRRWMKKAKTFVVPATRVNCSYLLSSPLLKELAPDVLEFVQRYSVTKAGDRPFPRWYNHKLNPFPDQHNAIHKAYRNDVWALYMRMGSGKSKAAIDLVTAAFFERRIDAVVVICPNAVKPVWLGNEIDTHSPCPTLKVDVDSSFQANLVPLSQSRLSWLVCGVEALSQGRTFSKLLPFIMNCKCAVIVDEATTIKNHKTIRTQRVIELGRPALIRGLMTGTPITKLIMDLYAQFEFLDPGIVGVGDFYAFRNRYAIMGGFKGKEVLGYDNVEELMQLIEPYVYICDKPKGLPEKLFTTRTVQLSPEQKDMYRKLRKAEIPEVSVANVLNRISKLQEIVGGFLRADPTRTVDPLTGREKRTQGKVIWELAADRNPKIQELHNLVEESGNEPRVVWCRFRWELEQVQKSLARHGPVAQLHGDIPDDDSFEGRTQVIKRFQNGDYRFIAATQQVGGIGHTMTAAHYMDYYSNTYSMIDRLQSEDRIHRIGQDENCLYTDIVADKTVDSLIQASLKDKKDLDVYVREKMTEASMTLNDLLGGEG